MRRSDLRQGQPAFFLFAKPPGDALVERLAQNSAKEIRIGQRLLVAACW
jgi:hypothetical protein